MTILNKKIKYLIELQPAGIVSNEDIFINELRDSIKIKKAGDSDFIILINGCLFFELVTATKRIYINANAVNKERFNLYCNEVIPFILKYKYDFIIEYWSSSVTAQNM